MWGCDRCIPVESKVRNAVNSLEFYTAEGSMYLSFYRDSKCKTGALATYPRDGEYYSAHTNSAIKHAAAFRVCHGDLVTA
ncbi:hypothetical protein BV22DRAFT_82732 [Leucogyrophana mollusca]|uniref:Uncharacterized protein n=1 Tax=Leucogyrophana mollusca TaxID=85980 RepID=A0ACB8BZX5_9AGAM|nr:hypothetical protein BV22DRAFT_82732 [Leucogyrophana mollusca]